MLQVPNSLAMQNLLNNSGSLTTKNTQLGFDKQGSELGNRNNHTFKLGGPIKATGAAIEKMENMI